MKISSNSDYLNGLVQDHLDNDLVLWQEFENSDVNRADEIWKEVEAIVKAAWIPTVKLISDLGDKYPFLVMEISGLQDHMEVVHIKVSETVENPDDLVETFTRNNLFVSQNRCRFSVYENTRAAIIQAIECMERIEELAAEQIAEQAKDYSNDIRKGTIIGLTKRMERKFEGVVDVYTDSGDYSHIEDHNKVTARFFFNDGNTNTIAFSAQTKKLALIGLEQKLTAPALKLVG